MSFELESTKTTLCDITSHDKPMEALNEAFRSIENDASLDMGMVTDVYMSQLTLNTIKEHIERHYGIGRIKDFISDEENHLWTAELNIDDTMTENLIRVSMRRHCDNRYA